MSMAKSTRSKVKRSFRSKKREEGVYAATEAARLHRLNAKLTSIAMKNNLQEEEQGDGDSLGWCWFATFGLLDPNEVTAESLGDIRGRRPRSRKGCLRTRGRHIGEA